MVLCFPATRLALCSVALCVSCIYQPLKLRPGDGSTDGGDGVAANGDDATPGDGGPCAIDFTPCEISTSPERDYDICINRVCRSPGCGTWECNAPSLGTALPDSGQRSCYDLGIWTSCPDLAACTTTPWCGQDAQYGWDVNHAASARLNRDDAVVDQPVMIDQVTGLAWQGCQEGISGATCATGTSSSLEWQGALAACEELDWGGHTDWRLPSDFELHTLVNHEHSGPCIDPIFPNANNLAMWTSSSAPTGGHWYINFFSGQVEIAGTSITHARVRCVRRHTATLTQAPSRFLRDLTSEPVVLDTTTGLTWQGCPGSSSGSLCDVGSPAARTWSAALDGCQNLSWGGHGDWVLPDVIQLRSLVKHTDAPVAIDTGTFPETSMHRFWSSTSAVDNPRNAFTVHFGDGEATRVMKTNALLVRCVRAPD